MREQAHRLAPDARRRQPSEPGRGRFRPAGRRPLRGRLAARELARRARCRRRQGRLQEALRTAPRGVPAGAGRRARQARESFDAERARVAAALAAKRAGSLEAASLAWLLPESDDDAAIADGLVTGTILGAYRFDRFLSRDPEDPPPPKLESLTLLAPDGVAAAAETARVCAEAQNRARDLQSLPSNVATPSFLAARAEEIAAAHDSVSAEVLGREEIAAKEMGGLVAVSQGGPEEPRLIVLRYSGGGRADAGPGRQGRHLRHRRHLDQALGRHARDEDGHVGRRRGARGGRGDRRAGAAGRPDRRRPLDREHALGNGDQAGRRDHPVQRQDGRGQQHRRRGPPDPRRRPRLRDRARRRAGRRPGDADRRGADRARLDLRGGDLQRRRARRRRSRRPARRPASWSGGCRCTPSTRRS